MISSITRMYGRIIKKRSYRNVNVNSFRAGRSFTGIVIILRELVEKRSERNLRIYSVFVYLGKDYDSVPQKLLFQVLQKPSLLNIHSRYI